MPRKRKNEADLWLPARVYRGRQSYEYHPSTGGSVRLYPILRDVSGNFVETDEIKRAVIQARLDADQKLVKREDMNWLFDQYQNSPQCAALAVKTRTNDEIRLKRLRLVFGQMMPSRVTSGHIRAYMDKVGETAQASANRDHGYLGRVFSWAKERNMVSHHPVRDVKKFSEQARDRYVEDWEYDLVYQVALNSTYPWIAPMMEFAYLCRMRAGEVRALDKRRHLLADGVLVERGKGSKSEITLWSDRLRAAVSLAEQVCGSPRLTDSTPLFASRTGGFISDTAYKSAWRRVRQKAMEDGAMINGVRSRLIEPFNFHDLKAKGVTDHETKASGHKSKKMQAIYDRKPELIKSTR